MTQSDVDLWDGRSLTLLRRVMGLYEAAHAIEPSVPRLVPIALRTLLAPRTKPEKEEPAVPGEPTAGTQ